jgi:IS605 OrfB family transposase
MAGSHGTQVGIEAKIEAHPTLEILGFHYESWRRTALTWLQSGVPESEVEKRLQSTFDIDWAWADSIATEAGASLDQLVTAKELNIARIKEQIKKKLKRAKDTLKTLEKQLTVARKKGFPTPLAKTKFGNTLSGLKSKTLKLESLKRELENLETKERLHICFGSRKLFNAQHDLEANGYASHAEWLTDWRKKRSGRFYCVGKSQLGGGTMIKVFPVDDDSVSESGRSVSEQAGRSPGNYRLTIRIPRCLRNEYGEYLDLPLSVSDRDGRTRRADLNYALQTHKPITAQVFRREHKDDCWYVHLTTYVQPIPIVHNRKKGCIGIDFNKDYISLAYVKPDGNVAYIHEIAFEWKGLTTGQRQARIRDIVAEVVTLADYLNCALAIESLDFSKKKASMSEQSKLYNEMLSNLSTGLFKTSLESRCRRYGVELIKVNPAFTSIIGMIKFMSRYGLNSGTSAAMSIARRAMKLSEKIPQCLATPEDEARHSWSAWNRVARFLKLHRISRSRLFQWTKALGDILTSSPDETEHSPSLLVAIETGKSQNPHQSPKGEVRPDGHVQLCLDF